MTAKLLPRIARHRFSVADYYRMAEVGILREDQRVELIEGEVVEMPPIGSRHASVVDRITEVFSGAISLERRVIRVQNPVRLGDDSEPVPDVLLLKRREDYYAGAHPRPGDVLLLVEVSDTTLAYDRGVKLPLYARAGIPEVWVVDLKARTVEVNRQPTGSGYVEHRVVAADGELSPLAFPDSRFKVAAIVG